MSAAAAKCWILVISAVAVLGSARQAAAAAFGSDVYGYHFALPDEWQQIPDDVMRGMIGAIRNPKSNDKLVYDAAFQPKAHQRWFEYPYVLVTVTRYADLGPARQVTEAELEQIVAAISGTQFEKGVDQALKSDMRSRLSDLQVGPPQLDRGRHRYVMSSIATVAGAGDVKSVYAGYFGREAMVQVNFAVKEGEWEKYEPTVEVLLDSFHFDPAKEFSVAEANAVAARPPPPRSIWTGVGQNALAYGLVAAAIGAGGYVAAKWKERARHPPKSDST